MALLIVDLGLRDIERDVRRQFPTETVIEVVRREGQIDVLVEAKELARKFYERLTAAKTQTTEPIKVFLSGPVVLAFVFGMLVGLNHFNLEIYYYDATKIGDKYVAIGKPDHTWLKEIVQ